MIDEPQARINLIKHYALYRFKRNLQGAFGEKPDGPFRICCRLQAFRNGPVAIDRLYTESFFGGNLHSWIDRPYHATIEGEVIRIHRTFHYNERDIEDGYTLSIEVPRTIAAAEEIRHRVRRMTGVPGLLLLDTLNHRYVVHRVNDFDQALALMLGRSDSYFEEDEDW